VQVEQSESECKNLLQKVMAKSMEERTKLTNKAEENPKASVG